MALNEAGCFDARQLLTADQVQSIEMTAGQPRYAVEGRVQAGDFIELILTVDRAGRLLDVQRVQKIVTATVALLEGRV